MEESEVIKRVKNSIHAKKSKSEILRNFQKKGYKLEYAEAILKKVNNPKRVLIISLIVFLIIATISSITYSFITTRGEENLEDPLTGFATRNNQQVILGEEIRITPEFITFILNEMGAQDLHRNPLTFERAIINFVIEEESFTSTVKKEIVTVKGSNKKADLEFVSSRNEVIRIVTSSNQKEEVKKSIGEGKTKVNILASEAELFAKGYLKIYDGIK